VDDDRCWVERCDNSGNVRNGYKILSSKSALIIRTFIYEERRQEVGVQSRFVQLEPGFLWK
jgi:hypothetical protein